MYLTLLGKDKSPSFLVLNMELHFDGKFNITQVFLCLFILKDKNILHSNSVEELYN